MSIQNSLLKGFIRLATTLGKTEATVKIFETQGLKGEYLDKDNLRNSKFIAPEGYACNRYIINEYLRVEEIVSEKSTSKDVIYLLHGGAYIGPLSDSYNRFMVNCCKETNESKVVAIDYRRSRENPFPAAFEDAIIGWDYLIDSGYNPENIVICGDSAGGGLAFALTMYLRDKGISPKGVMSMSPWVNLKCEYTDLKRKKMDPFFGNNDSLKYCADLYKGDFSVEDWRISPIFGSFKDFPPVLITAGECEVFYDEILQCYKIMKEANVNAELRVYNKCMHDIQTFKGIVPEADKAWDDVREFYNSL